MTELNETRVNILAAKLLENPEFLDRVKATLCGTGEAPKSVGEFTPKWWRDDIRLCGFHPESEPADEDSDDWLEWVPQEEHSKTLWENAAREVARKTLELVEADAEKAHAELRLIGKPEGSPGRPRPFDPSFYADLILRRASMLRRGA